MHDLTISNRFLSVSIAYLLAVYAVDLLTHAIDIATLPMPRLVGGMSLMAWVPVMVMLMLKPSITARGGNIITGVDGFFFGVMLLWVAIEWMHSLSSGYANYTIIAATLPPYLIFMAVRSHIHVFGNRQLVIKAFIITSVSLAVVHLVLLALSRLGIFSTLINSSEVTGRNGISLMLTAVVFVSLFINPSHKRRIAWGNAFLVLLTLTHIILNGARAAAIILFLLILLKTAIMIWEKDRRIMYGVLIASGLIIIIVVWSHDLFTALGLIDPASLTRSDDNALSSLYRTRANADLIQALLHNPLTGLGVDHVLAIRAGGYISHTLYLIYLGAYGVLGILPFVICIGLLLYFSSATDEVIRSMTILLMVVVTSFVNDPFTWFGMLIALTVVPEKVVSRVEIKGANEDGHCTAGLSAPYLVP